MKRNLLLYYRTDEQIKKYQAIPAARRLLWLENAARFFNKLFYALPEKQQKSIKKFRRMKVK